MYDVEHTRILKHVSTRWLSVETCIPRILENWDALKVYFVEEKSSPGGKPNDASPSNKPGPSSSSCSSYKHSKVTQLETFYRSPTNTLYCLFLLSAIQPMEKLNTLFQAEKPLIHTLYRLLQKLFRDMLLRFVTPKGLHGKSLLDVEFSKAKNHKKIDDLIIGESARRFIQSKGENHRRSSRISEFYELVKKFYIAAGRCIMDKLPLTDELLQRAEVADFSLRMEKTGGDLVYFLDRFPALLPTGKDKMHLCSPFR